MTDLTSLDLETTAEERKAAPTWRTINGDSPFMARLLRDFDKLAAEVLRLRALTAPGEGCETTAEERSALAELIRRATSEPWEVDTEKNEGCYGIGDDVHEGFQSPVMFTADGKRLFDASNSDTASVGEEWDEDSHSAWDEVGRRNFELIAALRNASDRLLRDLARADARANEATAERDAERAARVKAEDALRRIADKRNIHFAGDAQALAQMTLASLSGATT